MAWPPCIAKTKKETKPKVFFFFGFGLTNHVSQITNYFNTNEKHGAPEELANPTRREEVRILPP